MKSSHSSANAAEELFADGEKAIMMMISLSNVSKRFHREWIIKKVTQTFTAGSSWAIIGPNGSGKSTLLQIIAGNLAPSEGEVVWQWQNQSVPDHQWHRYVGIAAPYLELIEEFTLLEFLQFHAQFKPFLPGLTIADVMELAALSHAKNKAIRHFSSGMKQRVKLAQAILSDVPVVCLDEPTTNLDKQGIQLYHSFIEQFSQNRLILVSSNDEQEYSFTQHQLHINHFK